MVSGANNSRNAGLAINNFSSSGTLLGVRFGRRPVQSRTSFRYG